MLQPVESDFIMFAGIKIYRLNTVLELESYLKSEQFDAVINVVTRLGEIRYDDAQRIQAATRAMGTKWVSLPHISDEIHEIVFNPESALENWDLIGMLGPRFLELLENLLYDFPEDKLKKLKDRLVIIGNPVFDGICNFDSDVILQKYGLPHNKAIIFLAPAPLYGWRGLVGNGLGCRFSGNGVPFRHAFSVLISLLRYPLCISYRDFLAKLRAFADKNNACIIAKTRSKHNDPDYLRDYVDAVIGDVSYFPFTTLELLSVSSLYFGFSSASVFEAIASGVYSINAFPLPAEVYNSVGSQYECLKDRITVWDTPGVSEMIDGTKRSGSGQLKRFASSNLNAYRMDEKYRKIFLDKYFGFLGRSSEQFCNALLSLWH